MKSRLSSGAGYFSTMNLVLFDDPVIRKDLLPFTFTRPVASIRTGILTIVEKWQGWFSQPVSFLTAAYLAETFPLVAASDNLLINGALCPDEQVVKALRGLETGETLCKDNVVLAVRSPQVALPGASSKKKEYGGDITLIDKTWKIFQHNGAQIRADFERVTHRRESQKIEDPHARLYAPENIFVEEGATFRANILNASEGPIYIGKNVQVHEGAIIRGPFSIGADSVINMGAKLRENVSVGPMCKVGGEISNAVIFGYSSKVHDGFLGSSVIGEWCNLGADTNTSNLKNNYDSVKLWSYAKGGFESTGLMFCGLMMGDYSKCGINTMFNAGTVAGVSANIFGDGYPRNFIPSFAWGGAAGFTTFQLNKVYETAAKAMERRNRVLTDTDKKILENVFHQTAQERIWEKKQ